jgi:hypothetical protein
MKNEMKTDSTKPVFVYVWNESGDKHRRIYLFSFDDRHYCVPVEKHDAYLRGEKVNAVIWDHIEFIKEKKTIVEPWSFETCPWPLALQYKSAQECLTFSTKRSTGVLCAGTFYSYEYLVEFFKQLDGSPCGLVREVDA